MRHSPATVTSSLALVRRHVFAAGTCVHVVALFRRSPCGQFRPRFHPLPVTPLRALAYLAPRGNLRIARSVRVQRTPPTENANSCTPVPFTREYRANDGMTGERGRDGTHASAQRHKGERGTDGRWTAYPQRTDGRTARTARMEPPAATARRTRRARQPHSALRVQCIHRVRPCIRVAEGLGPTSRIRQWRVRSGGDATADRLPQRVLTVVRRRNA